ncbi:MAG: CRISPR-associated protein Csx3 [Thermodesulfovibrionales bacterium]|nr:CRISPR-associated protein Csx3 [Thermodesulfovibrionales bacterium]
MEIVIDVNTLYKNTSSEDTAKISQLKDYLQKALELAGEGNDVILTGAGPIWLYLKIAHALHGRARKLIYRSPVTGDVVIFDHTP